MAFREWKIGQVGEVQRERGERGNDMGPDRSWLLRLTESFRLRSYTITYVYVLYFLISMHRSH